MAASGAMRLTCPGWTRAAAALTLHGWYRYNSQLLGQTPKQCEKKSVDYRHVLQQGEKERDHSLQKLRALSIGRTDKKLRCPVP
ncbi:uncharacterized protein LOC144457771 isoform X2 [Phascolarctos cinereus]